MISWMVATDVTGAQGRYENVPPGVQVRLPPDTHTVTLLLDRPGVIYDSTGRAQRVAAGEVTLPALGASWLVGQPEVEAPRAQRGWDWLRNIFS